MTAERLSGQAIEIVVANLDVGLVSIFLFFLTVCVTVGAAIGKVCEGRKGAALGAVVAALLAPVLWIATWPLWIEVW